MKWQKKAVVISVYICEAHASDEWPVGKSISACKQPKSLPERLVIANQFNQIRSFKVPMLVDTIENQFQTVFAAWPFRFFIVKDGHIAYKAEPHPISLAYDVRDLDSILPPFLV